MTPPKKELFRQAALDRLSSPEQLNQRMQILGFNGWLFLGVVGVFAGAAVVWSIVGRIPVTVEGRGILLYPQAQQGTTVQVANVQAKGDGRLTRLTVRVGDVVQRGEVIGAIALEDVREQLRTTQTRLALLQQQNQELAGLEQTNRGQVATVNRELEQQYRTQMTQIRQRAETARAQSLAALQVQRASYTQQLAQAESLTESYREAVAVRDRLRQQGLLVEDQYLQAEQNYLQNLAKISDLKAQLAQLQARQVEIQQTYAQAMAQVTDLQAKINALQQQQQSQAIATTQTQAERKNEIAQLQQQVQELSQQLQTNGTIVSPYGGRVASVLTQPGQLVTPGQPVAVVEVAQADTAELIVLSYFPVGRGKQLRPGMKVEVTPDTVQRERFGGLLGQVARVSDYPVDPDAIAAAVGESALSQQLTGGASGIEVLIDLERDRAAPSGYRWTSSRGPDQSPTFGTTATVRATVEERPPITFVLPFFRELFGLD